MVGENSLKSYCESTFRVTYENKTLITGEKSYFN